MPVGVVAARFHAGLARATARACERLAGEHGLELVVLSGGVFQNRVLLEGTLAELGRAGLRTLVPERLPAGDGGISYGQAAVAAARLASS
jgi:hydrogenase maturation protein HypF